MVECEICKGKKFSLMATRIREGEGRIVKCADCGLIAQDILERSGAKIKEYYESEYQATNSLVSGKVETASEHYASRMKTIGSVFDEVRPLLKKKSRVLEVGCGAGELLSLIRPKVKLCAGVELNSAFVDFIKSDLKITAYAADVNELKLNERFDLIISISTLDHLPNPLQTLISMKGLLRPGGKIYIEVPNVEEALNKFLPGDSRKRYNEFFWHRAHLFYFSKNTISALFEKAGLGVEVCCRHEYTLKNFLQWYFIGRPQNSFVTGLTETGLFAGKSDFESRMNGMFGKMEKYFKKIMAETSGGDSLCCLGST